MLEIASYLERVFGVEVTRVQPDHQGIVTVDAVQAALKPNTILVSIMMVGVTAVAAGGLVMNESLMFSCG